MCKLCADTSIRRAYKLRGLYPRVFIPGIEKGASKQPLAVLIKTNMFCIFWVQLNLSTINGHLGDRRKWPL